jgi:hypothetical protein
MGTERVRMSHHDDLNSDDWKIINKVDASLRRGVEMRRWWDSRRRSGGFAEEFQLVRRFNKADVGYGFYDTATVDDGLPVMGSVAEEFFDQPKSDDVEQWRTEIREFVLHYLLRVSDFRSPDVFVNQQYNSLPSAFRGFSWCPENQDTRGGFGYSQLYYKRRDTGQIGKFAESERFAIVDVRELDAEYEWVVLSVRIFNFVITVSPPARINPISAQGPQIGFPLSEETLVVLSREFVSNADQPQPGIAGRYGFGYALLDQSSDSTLLAYGPGHFQAGFQLFTFDVSESTGQVKSRRAFVVNRPDRVLNVPLNPLHLGCRIADLMSFGLGSRALTFGQKMCEALPGNLTFDPVFPTIRFVNAVTGGISASQFCISKEQLETIFLQQHYKQDYDLTVGALRTWRSVRNWLDTAALPQSIVQGVTV